MPAASKSSKSKPASGGSGNKQPSRMLASGNTKAVMDAKKKKKIHVESKEMDERTKKKKIVVETKEPNAEKKKKIEVETKETNVNEKKKTVETTATKKKNSLASGSDSSATKRNEGTFKNKSDSSSDDTSSESYSYYGDSSLASGSEDEPRDEPKPKPVSKLVDKPAEQPQPAEEEEIDWGGRDSESTYSETSEEEADEPATGGIPIAGDSIGDVSDMLATGGMKSVRLTPASREGNDSDVGYEDEKDGDGWTWQQWQPWKKTKFEPYSGHWQKSSSSWQESWQQKSSWQQNSSWTWRRQYHKQQCHWLASGSPGSYDVSSSMTSAGTSEGHSSESLLAPGSMRRSNAMRPQLADALSRWPAWPSSSLMEEGGLAAFASRAILQVKNIQEDPPEDFQEWALQTALPLDRPASGGVGYMSIKDVVNFHRGEVRQLGGGGWATCDSKSEEFAAKNVQLRGLIVKLASGSAPQLRVSKVFSVMDLFMAMGKMYSAKELYDAYLSCDIIARRRTRSK